jgi:hypothetical protein
MPSPRKPLTRQEKQKLKADLAALATALVRLGASLSPRACCRAGSRATRSSLMALA